MQNELVKARLRNEEMEEDLVRYKLLYVLGLLVGQHSKIIGSYAQAMHESQDAQSSHRISIAQLALKQGSK